MVVVRQVKLDSHARACHLCERSVLMGEWAIVCAVSLWQPFNILEYMNPRKHAETYLLFPLVLFPLTLFPLVPFPLASAALTFGSIRGCLVPLLLALRQAAFIWSKKAKNLQLVSCL